MASVYTDTGRSSDVGSGARETDASRTGVLPVLHIGEREEKEFRAPGGKFLQ